MFLVAGVRVKWPRNVLYMPVNAFGAKVRIDKLETQVLDSVSVFWIAGLGFGV